MTGETFSEDHAEGFECRSDRKLYMDFMFESVAGRPLEFEHLCCKNMITAAKLADCRCHRC